MLKKLITLFLLLSIFVSSVSLVSAQEKQLTEAEQKRIETLRQEIAVIETEMNEWMRNYPDPENNLREYLR